MFLKLKLWWYCGIRKQVLFKPDGFTPYDYKGLQLVSGKPYTKDAKYKITDKWDSWFYQGDGFYFSPYCVWRFDREHPSRVAAFREVVARFEKAFSDQCK